jgi:hypothetical protein
MALNTEDSARDGSNQAPQTATAAVLMPSEALPAGSKEVHGVDFNQFHGRNISVDDLVSCMSNMGFQASALGEAVRIINEMVWTDASQNHHPKDMKIQTLHRILMLNFWFLLKWRT